MEEAPPSVLPSNPKILAYYLQILIGLSLTKLELLSIEFAFSLACITLGLSFPSLISRLLNLNDFPLFFIYFIARKVQIIWYYFSVRNCLSLISLLTSKPPAPNFKHYTIYEALLIALIIYLQTTSSLFRDEGPAAPLNMLPINVLNTMVFLLSYFDFSNPDHSAIMVYVALFVALILLFGLQFYKFEPFSIFLNRVLTLIFVENIALFLYMLLTVIIGVIFVSRWGLQSSQSLTVKRKYFHILAAILLLPPLLISVRFVYSQPAFAALAINTAFFFFVVIEASRRLLSPRFKLFQTLDSYLKLFACEEQMKANFIFSPLYLLLGIALPQILDSYSLSKPVFLSLGIIFLGFGDTAAAIIGSKYGKRKIYQSKTLQGCIAGFVAMLLALVLIIGALLMLSSIEPSIIKTEIIPAFGAILAGSISQLFLRNDNLTVPPVMIVFYSGLNRMIN